MCATCRIVLVGICLLVISVAAGASDYKVWLPLVPKTFGNMGISGKPGGMNMEMSGRTWSSLHQRYGGGDDSSKYIELTIAQGKGAPQMATFESMSSINMETEEQLVKTETISGYKALLNLDRTNNRGTLMISLGNDTLVVIESEPITSESEINKLAEELPLAKFVVQRK